MRPLTEEETSTFFEKLTKYIGDSVSLLLDRQDGAYCFRLYRERVFYVREDLMKKAENIRRPNLLSFGTCFGRFTKTKRFRLDITAVNCLSPYAKYKVWLKPAAELQFLYGHNVLKSGLGRITEGTQQYQGVIVYSMSDMPLGFGVAAKSTEACRHADPMMPVVFHQADIGQYIRHEESLT